MSRKKLILNTIKYILPVLVLFTYFLWSLLFSENYKVDAKLDNPIQLDIKDQASLDELIKLLKENGKLESVWSFKLMSSIKSFEYNIKSGTVQLYDSYNNNDLINVLRLPSKRVLDLQIPENIRLIEDMIVILEDSLGFKRGDLRTYLDTSSFLSNNGFNMQTLSAFFIPNTYQLYKGLSVESFFKKMKREYNSFWNEKRISKCDSLGLTQIEVSTLASIVEEEQDKRLDERPMIAGLYLNRLNNPLSFPYLQADPTVKFANKNFGIKQVLYKHTDIDSPYNTYKTKGLPPGPICIPSINAIDAVLNASQHDYYFMCAGSNGDGYHKFTSSNKEHNRNKNKYKKYQNFK